VTGEQPHNHPLAASTSRCASGCCVVTYLLSLSPLACIHFHPLSKLVVGNALTPSCAFASRREPGWLLRTVSVCEYPEQTELRRMCSEATAPVSGETCGIPVTCARSVMGGGGSGRLCLYTVDTNRAPWRVVISQSPAKRCIQTHSTLASLPWCSLLILLIVHCAISLTHRARLVCMQVSTRRWGGRAVRQ